MNSKEKKEYLLLKEKEANRIKRNKKIVNGIKTTLNHPATKLFGVSLAAYACSIGLPSGGYLSAIWHNIITSVVAISSMAGAASIGKSGIDYAMETYLIEKEEPLLLENKEIVIDGELEDEE